MGGALLCDLGLFLSLRFPGTELSCKDRRADTFPTEAVTRVHPKEVYLATAVSRASERTALLPSLISSTRVIPPAVTTGPQSGDLGFSALGVPFLPPLPASGLPTRGSRGPDRS